MYAMSLNKMKRIRFYVISLHLMLVSTICLGCSKNPVNQATAKATLTQMINIVLRRMESDVEVIFVLA
jgi:hypothetical protein